MLRSVGERRVTTPWGASAAFAPPASTTSRAVEDARTSTSAPPARTPASSAAPTQTGVTSVDVRPGTTVPGKGTWAKGHVKVACSGSGLINRFVLVPQTLCHGSGLRHQLRWPWTGRRSGR